MVDKNVNLNINEKAIDHELSLRLANNNHQLAKELLSMLIAELPQTLASINQAYKKGDYNALQQHVHKLHGACCYCGVPRLKKIAIKIEGILKSNSKLLTDDLINVLNNEIEKICVTFKTENKDK